MKFEMMAKIRKECLEMVDSLDELSKREDVKDYSNQYFGKCKQSGNVKRMSMKLSNTLIECRKPMKF